MTSVLPAKLGYGILVVPTGIVTVEIARAARPASPERCPRHPDTRHDPDARFCRLCATPLAPWYEDARRHALHRRHDALRTVPAEP